jgi:hypothetical protein
LGGGGRARENRRFSRSAKREIRVSHKECHMNGRMRIIQRHSI